MKKILCLLLFVLFALFSVSARENQKIMFKNGKSVLMSDVISKDQFGIMIVCGKDTETGVKLRRFVPFAEMNPASLSLFPFCDVKAVERIHTAVQDRAKLLQVRFAKKYQQFENEKDYTKLLKIHSGVPSYEILFSARETLPNGLIGFLYSDTPSALFYGKIYLHGLKGEADTVWIGVIYPTEKTFTHKGAVYPMFTVIPPERKEPEYGEMEQTRKKVRGEDGEQKKFRPRGERPARSGGNMPGKNFQPRNRGTQGAAAGGPGGAARNVPVRRK